MKTGKFYFLLKHSQFEVAGYLSADNFKITAIWELFLIMQLSSYSAWIFFCIVCTLTYQFMFFVVKATVINLVKLKKYF